MKVKKPARYIGGEWNSVVKDHKDIKCKVALAFPDVYEVGMSHLGLKILYSLLNDRQDIACERVFAPWFDMEGIMRERKIPLFSLETKSPLKEFDIVGFSLQYELSYTNVLNMLDLSGIPLFSVERGDSHPLIIGGGPCAFNPEPMADFFDCFLMGDGEEAVAEIADIFIESRKKGDKKEGLLKRLADVEGVYVPSLTAEQAGMIKKVKKRSVLNLDEAYYPERPVVPYIEVVHDRIQLEIMRGCRRRCNFCQAGVIYRPNRQRSAEKIVSLAKKIYENTGYDEMSLASLSSGDHSQIMDIAASLKRLFEDKGVGISLPSLRVEDLVSRFPLEMASGKHTGLTFAPEVGSEKMRKVINKDISPATLKECALQAFKNGWRRIKLYFMIGLPEEDYSDLDAIVELAKEISEAKKNVDGRPAEINASVSVFIPKPHTKFERAAMLPMDEAGKRQRYIKEKAGKTRVKFTFHDARMSYLEAALTRGDRSLSKVIYNAWKNGCKFDGWSEYFDFEKWQEAFKDAGIDPDRYALRQRGEGEALPWSFIDV
ncbi:MAG: TIGR03960 family B12-binding radical SAM protein [Candidatus Omnitrophota bacterium]|nr:TIGR03960 family B12-binding radical SAM protein [Candidatus Omnitrophota bacterium]